MASLLISLAPVPGVSAGDWELMRERYDALVRAQEKRIAEIEARAGAMPADRQKRAERITRDRIAGIRAARKDGMARSLVDNADKASRGEMALADVSSEQSAYLDLLAREWGPEGAERRRLRAAVAALERNLARARADVARAAEVAEAAAASVQESGVLEKVAQVETEAREAGERLRARWQRERGAQERAREHREREAGERSRTLR